MGRSSGIRYIFGVSVSVFTLSFSPATAQSQRVSPYFKNLLVMHRDGTASIGVGDSNGIIEGMSTGDQTDPRAAIKKGGPFFPLLALVAVDRMSGDVSNAISDTELLKRSLREAGFPYDVESLAYFADILGAGNKILEGDLTGWIRAIDAVRKHYVTPVRHALNMPALSFSDLDVFEPDIAVADIPQQSADIADDNQLAYSIPSRFIGQPGVYPYVQGSLNGTPVNFQLTTGSFFGVMPQEVFNTGHYREIGHINVSIDAMGRKTLARYVMVDTITLDKSTFHNVIFKVTKSDFLTLGMSFLRQLPHVTLAQSALSFGVNAPYRCTTPIHLSMNMDGTALSLVFPIVSPRSTQWSTFATGLQGGTAFFTVTPHFTQTELRQSEQTAGNTSHGLGFYKAVETPFDTSLYGVRLHDKVQKILAPYATSKSRISITANLLLYGNVSYDFGSRTACFTARK